jgi:GAF domain-containing protein
MPADQSMIGLGTTVRRGLQMSRTPHSTLADPDQIIANLQRQLAECKAELDQRTAERDALQRELVASGEHHIATAEVLQVINSSPGDLAPVFDAMLQKALSLCGAAFGQLVTFDGVVFRAAAWRGYKPGPSATTPTPGMALYQLVHGEQIVHIPDITADDVYRSGNAVRRVLADKYGGRTAIWVALRKDSALLGAFVIYRTEVRPFTEKQIALLENFAAQAVIAMENARLITETCEALEQQTATAEVLQVINSSPGDLAPVFKAMLDKATRLCEASFGTLWTYDGESMQAVAIQGSSPQYTEFLKRGPHSPSPVQRRLIHGESVVQVADVAAGEGYRSRDPLARALVDLGGIRSLLAVPLRKDNALLGAISVYRQEVRAFSDKQIALLQNFAAQAVIAMENARLITETREALDQQTATAEVLQVINSSPGDLAPVYDAILEKARGLCGVAVGGLTLYDGEQLRAVTVHGLPEQFVEEALRPFRPGPAHERLIHGERLVHISDFMAVALESTHPATRAFVEMGVRTTLLVPLRKDDTLLGYIAANRLEVRPFSDKEIALLESFAAQAVIAMDNARLLTELRQRTRDLEESLEYQTASSDVLKVISRSGAELGSVLDMLVETAARICRADSGFIFRLHDGFCRMVASFGIPAEYKHFQECNPIVPSRGTLAGRTVLERRAVHIDDAATDPQYTRVQAVRLGRQRTMLGVPLIREDALIGVITLARSYVEPFAEKQIGLVTTFADQAVIAIENARLFGELRTRTAEL